MALLSPSSPLLSSQFTANARRSAGFCALPLLFGHPLHGISTPSSTTKYRGLSVCLAVDPASTHLSAIPCFSLAESGGYSLASYYTSLGLFIISVPGVWSLIKRSVKSKIVQKTFVRDGTEEKSTAPNQVAGEILSFFTRNNFNVSDRGEIVTFEGTMVPSRGQAALLTFCTCISLASVALVLTITVPDVGNGWFWLTALSPLAGVYYWTRASRKEEIKVKMILADDGKLSEIIVQGDDEQIERMRKELNFMEKGMVYVKGLFER
ncbi:COFACTOR ASSEMBLY OF COMPLEX C SUBUNIT B protein [Nymphaea thermarum]|nr:COFACTOR ASSEMBLY OF COMPLEX C SUBUNIT B protein [Nymphaea thermarum]